VSDADVTTGAAVLGYTLPVYEFTRPPELRGTARGQYPVVIVGAGLAGLTLAAELGRRGIEVVLLEQGSSLGVVGIASRGIAYAKRTLEIFDRIGIAERMRAKGQVWNEGRIYDGLEEIDHVVLQPPEDEKWPAFINLQQFYVEQFLVERLAELGNVDIRWRSRLVAARHGSDQVSLTVLTPDGEYTLEAGWVAACDGAGSAVRHHLGIEAPLAQLKDTWAIVDVKTEMPGLQRKIWLNSPLIDGGAIVMHPMADGVVRVDWQVGHLADPELEVTPERVRERLASFLGERRFQIVSVSRWSYRRRVMDRLVHGRAVFLGDAAHEIPPFGARGGNGGIQDAENLAWKLQAVIGGSATPALLDSYDRERGQAAAENALLACRSQAFITPRTRQGRLLRDAVIGLARDHEFARTLVNTGRASSPTCYAGTPLAVDDAEPFDGGPAPGAAAPDGPLGRGFLLDARGDGFLGVHFEPERSAAGPEPERGGEGEDRGSVRGFAIEHVDVPSGPGTATLRARWAAEDGATYVIRPDGHVLGRTRRVSTRGVAPMVASALDRADPRWP
jgi:3-(3-hydroxy-phenyl)propionate hydroxylase